MKVRIEIGVEVNRFTSYHNDSNLTAFLQHAPARQLAPPSAMANQNPERDTTKPPPQSRGTRIAGESAAQVPRAPATHDGTSAANTDLHSRGAKRKREFTAHEARSRAATYHSHYAACSPSSFVVAAHEEAARAGRSTPFIYDAPRHERALARTLAELAKQDAVAADASGSSEAGAAEEPLLSGHEDVRVDPEDVRLPKTSERMRAEDSEENAWD